MAQLVERLLTTLKVHSSNTIIGQNLYFPLINCIEKTKISSKTGAGNGRKKLSLLTLRFAFMVLRLNILISNLFF